MSTDYAIRLEGDASRHRRDGRGAHSAALAGAGRRERTDASAGSGRTAGAPTDARVDRLVAQGGLLLGFDCEARTAPVADRLVAQRGVLLEADGGLAAAPAGRTAYGAMRLTPIGADEQQGPNSAGVSVERLLAEGGVLLVADAGLPAEPGATATRRAGIAGASSGVDAAGGVFDSDGDGDELQRALGLLAAAVDALRDVDLTRLSDVQVEDGLRRFVVECRRLPGVRHGLVSEVVDRCLPQLRRSGSTGLYLRGLLRLSLREARAWERDATDLTPGRSLSTGEPLPAKHPAVAAAVAAGAVSTAHARMVTDTLRRVPVVVGREERVRTEVRLVRYATLHDPATLSRRCQEELERLDPDGSLGSTPAERDRARGFRVGKQDKQGMYPVTGRLDPEVGALVQAALPPLSSPQPGPDGDPDLRTSDQRQHDALGELARRALAGQLGGDLPVRHGLAARLLVTITLDQLEARTGTVSTPHGGRLPVRDLLRLACETGVIPIVFDSDGQVLHHGKEQRFATEAQRLAMYALDGGCAYDGCTIPGIWNQGAHGDPFRHSRKTTIDDLALLCGFHHRKVDNEEWVIKRIKGRVWLTPPKWIDPDQTPRTNQHFRPLRE